MADLDLSATLAKQIEEIQKAGGQLTDQGLNQLVKPITSAFRVRKDEVAILRLSPDGKVLNFLYPVRLAKVGAIPLSTSHSLAAKTIRDKKGEIINDFSRYRHATFFEAVDLSEEDKAKPIQKIMSVPMILDGKVTGVIQLSRKKRSGESVGPDFTAANLTELSKVAGILSKFLSTLPAPALPSAKPANS